MGCCMLNLPAVRLDPGQLVTHELPGGAVNAVNLAFTTAKVFAPGTLQVFMDGKRLDPADYTEGADFKSFTLVIQPGTPNRLNKAPKQSEEIRVAYLVAVHSGCEVLCV